MNNFKIYLQNDYRLKNWEKSKDILEKISKVIPIESVLVLGSFMTKKDRPADVDFIVMIKTKESEDYSTDIQFVPSNFFGDRTIEDAKNWMSEKYGNGNYETFEFSIDELKNY